MTKTDGFVNGVNMFMSFSVTRSHFSENNFQMQGNSHFT